MLFVVSISNIMKYLFKLFLIITQQKPLGEQEPIILTDYVDEPMKM